MHLHYRNASMAQADRSEKAQATAVLPCAGRPSGLHSCNKGLLDITIAHHNNAIDHGMLQAPWLDQGTVDSPLIGLLPSRLSGGIACVGALCDVSMAMALRLYV